MDQMLAFFRIDPKANLIFSLYGQIFLRENSLIIQRSSLHLLGTLTLDINQLLSLDKSYRY